MRARGKVAPTLYGRANKTSFLKGNLRAREDDFRTFLGDFVAVLPQIDFPARVALQLGI
jgi:hypothetical protein